MVSFLTRNDDTALIRIILGEQSKMNAAIYGGDSLDLNDIVNTINEDDNIKNVKLSISYYEDEEKIMNRVKNDVNHFEKNKKENDEVESDGDQKKTKKNKKTQSTVNDFKCPECGGNDCLVDKEGNKYPCLSCLQIDIAQKITKMLGEKLDKTVSKNNDIIKALIELFKGKEK